NLNNFRVGPNCKFHCLKGLGGVFAVWTPNFAKLHKCPFGLWGEVAPMHVPSWAGRWGGLPLTATPVHVGGGWLLEAFAPNSSSPSSFFFSHGSCYLWSLIRL